MSTDAGATPPNENVGHSTETCRQSVPLSVCEACDGEDQKLFEPLKYHGRFREWMCASCREVLLPGPAAAASAQPSPSPESVAAPPPAPDTDPKPSGVAALYPARKDSNGAIWYRPLCDAGVSLDKWGWTADPNQAHPDYHAASSA